MVSKIVHVFKYGLLGSIIGGAIKIFIEWDNHLIEFKPIAIWIGVGALAGLLVSVVMEKWFNETYHD